MDQEGVVGFSLFFSFFLHSPIFRLIHIRSAPPAERPRPPRRPLHLCRWTRDMTLATATRSARGKGPRGRAGRQSIGSHLHEEGVFFLPSALAIFFFFFRLPPLSCAPRALPCFALLSAPASEDARAASPQIGARGGQVEGGMTGRLLDSDWAFEREGSC